MYQRKLKQKDLANVLNTTPSRISEFLNGKLKLTYGFARELYYKLNIEPELIFKY
jgi:HTH-type transcriptional regulator/antitoxin HigA